MGSGTQPVAIRSATSADIDAIVAIVNDAYRVEAFFVAGDRVIAADITPLIDAGECLVLVAGPVIVGCIHVSTAGGQGYFGMLAIAPDRQGQGFGRRLIAAAEDRARAAGCATMRIKVVNLRTDLLAFYGRLGYVAGGTEPYTHRPVRQPCHFVLMEKRLR